MSKGDWVVVTAQSELRPGLLVKSRCDECGAWSIQVLGKESPAMRGHRNGRHCGLPAFRIQYLTTCRCDEGDGTWVHCFHLNGDVFRLAPDTTHETTNTRVRERVGAEGNRR